MFHRYFFLKFKISVFLQNSCEYDYVRITSVSAMGRTIENHGTFCGKVTSHFLITSGTNHLRVEFSSDSSVAKSGFAAVYFTGVNFTENKFIF